MAENRKLLGILREIAIKERLQNYDIKVTPTSSGGANYSSILFNITITSENQPPLQLFAKIAAMGDAIRKDIKFKDITFNVFEVEKFIYTELKDIFRTIEKKHHVKEKDRFNMCLMYAAHTKPNEEFILFEDLMTQGFSTYDRMKSITWEYGAAVCTELAKFHSLSLALENEYPEKYAETLKFLDSEIFTIMYKDMEKVFQGTCQTALNSVRAENRGRLENFVKSMDFKTYNNSFEQSKKKVLMHGDYRCSNIMHREGDDGSIDVFPLDYQTIRGGSMVADLYYFIFTGTDSQFRAQYYDKLIAHYYSELCASITRLGMDPDQVYPREDFEFELKEKLPLALGMSIMILPIVTVNLEHAPKVDKDLVISDFNVKTSAIYVERINGIIDDFIRWGAL